MLSPLARGRDVRVQSRRRRGGFAQLPRVHVTGRLKMRSMSSATTADCLCRPSEAAKLIVAGPESEVLVAYLDLPCRGPVQCPRWSRTALTGGENTSPLTTLGVTAETDRVLPAICR